MTEAQKLRKDYKINTNLSEKQYQADMTWWDVKLCG